jgi:hypothetical protein
MGDQSMKAMRENGSIQRVRAFPDRFRCLLLLPIVVSFALTVKALAQDDSKGFDVAELQAQVEELRNLAVRTQSHVMIDVEYHFTNLWFAAQNEQWELAAFYLRETGSHLAWTVRIRPVRTIRGGGSIDLEPFRASIEGAGFTQLQSAIEQENIDAFETAYGQTLTQCQACHQAAGLGYLQPHVPEKPLSGLMLSDHRPRTD